MGGGGCPGRRQYPPAHLRNGAGCQRGLVRLFVLAVLSLGLLNPHLESESRECTPILHLLWWTALPARMLVMARQRAQAV